jgi:hypothetical protein
VSEGSDWLSSVVHAQEAAGSLEVVGGGLESGVLRAIIRDKLHDELSWSVNNSISGHVLISVGVTTDDDGLGPAGDKARYVSADNGLTEYGTVKDVTDSSVGGLPHLLKVELLDTVLIGGNGSTLDTNLVLFDGVGRLNCNLIFSGITVFNGEIVVLQININIGSNVL